MKMWKKIKKPSIKKKKVPPRVSSLPQVVHILPTRQASINKLQNPSRSAMDSRKNELPSEIVVPPFSFQGHSISNENQFPNNPTSWDSIQSIATHADGDDRLSVLTNENYRFSESRQDSFTGSLSASRKASFQSREAPPESARSKVLTHNRSFRAKRHTKHSKFTLRPKSIVRKWNRYADMEENGLAASPRHRTKLAKSFHLELAPTVSSDSNEEPVAPTAEDTMLVEQEEEKDTVAANSESCPNRAVQDDIMEDNESAAATESDAMLVGEGILTPTHESFANREAEADSMEVISKAESDPSSESSMARTDDIRRITESGFPASVLDAENEPMEPPSHVNSNICTSNKSDKVAVKSTSGRETDLSHQNMQIDTTNKGSRQEEIVTLSLAQILVQSYQPDPNNPGYWKRKGAEDETKAEAPKPFVRKHSPLPTLNTFLAEVKARRNEIFTKNEAQENESGGEPDLAVDWYGAKRQEKQVPHGQKTNPSRPKDLFAELKAKQRDIAGRPPVSKPHQKRVVVCKPSSVGSANDLLSELKAKQQQLRNRAIVHPKTKEATSNERGTGFLPDIMTELKEKQRELKSRPASPPKRVIDPIANKKNTSSNPGVVSGLRAKQRAIEDRFYARLANLQNTLRGNEVVVIPKKS